jgi:polyphosphate kinase
MAKRKTPVVDLNDPTLYLNRELSLLQFQYRVLAEARDDNYPVLERLKFLAYVFSNLDEFFMVRAGGLKMQHDAGVSRLSVDGLTPAEQLAEVRKMSYQLKVEALQFWQQELHPALDEAGIHILNYSDLNRKQKASVNEYFKDVVFPVLIPLAYDPGHPFPHISNLSLNMAVIIKDKGGDRRFARVKVPSILPRFVPIKRSSGGARKDGTVPHNHYFVWLDQVISANLGDLFPGMKVMETHSFRVIRNTDMIIQELEAGDLLETMEESVRRRRFGAVVMLSVNADMPEDVLGILTENLHADQRDVYRYRGPLGMSSLMELADIDRFDLKAEQFLPGIPVPLRHLGENGTIFAAIRNGDILLHHPYDSFDPVIDFLRTASQDRNVLAIKQTLYRAGKNSPVVDALLRARREHGKQVAALVELKARFDEESNIDWARKLEQEGVHVTYGLLGLKTHSKIAMVVRQESDRIRRYVHLSTGNYNHRTAQSYEDIGLFTCDDDIGADATDLFNYLTGYSAIKSFRKLFVAPINLREGIEKLIERETGHQKNGAPGHLIFKMNALVDKRIIEKLYEASMAGVRVDLIVRGICCLRPGVEGVSENIRVISVLGRFLEHSRIYYFHNGGKEDIYMGSADLMPRNLDNRVEILYPVQDKQMVRYIREEILGLYLLQHLRGWEMNPDGTYHRLEVKAPEMPFNPQDALVRGGEMILEN